ncbi:hypothetical protein [Haladaptatus sp. DJG-WS-42]|uniref:hypothetical protein n=1 Tax=Haladaptatus sp. DJG-WS-42 TaxID=3120516 RepID=UPI0030D58720
MRGPLHALWNMRLLGTYLRFRVALVLAGVLAIIGGVLALGIGGLGGLVALFGIVALLLLALGFIVITR